MLSNINSHLDFSILSFMTLIRFICNLHPIFPLKIGTIIYISSFCSHVLLSAQINDAKDSGNQRSSCYFLHGLFCRLTTISRSRGRYNTMLSNLYARDCNWSYSHKKRVFAIGWDEKKILWTHLQILQNEVFIHANVVELSMNVIFLERMREQAFDESRSLIVCFRWTDQVWLGCTYLHKRYDMQLTFFLATFGLDNSIQNMITRMFSSFKIDHLAPILSWVPGICYLQSLREEHSMRWL